MRVLGIESSCDELALAVLEPDGTSVRASRIHTQVDLHAVFGGIVPEVASRDHVNRLDGMLEAVLDDAGPLGFDQLDGIAVTAGPGLVGSLLCGIEFAKGLALASAKPMIGIHHLEGHVASCFLEDRLPSLPATVLLVSGGHTLLFEALGPTGPYRRLGATRDDAAGEAFDKTAKLLGLGYPGGAVIDRLAKGGDPTRFVFPKLMPGKDNLDFSFSGLKTEVRRQLERDPSIREGALLADFCASFQRTVVENLLDKSLRAAQRTGQLVIAGGVAANSLLRKEASDRGAAIGVQVYLPSRENCTDNGAMIARAGWTRLSRGEASDYQLTARARWDLFSLPS
ncbi:MAG: tRNA (adenosine(37)-N6)-threonylcarbamoyltransferase complex transferase subunit TsaD [Myxococcales bacterium]|nr:tRNA (adenosine(37)-N6)-threonylcarbamoyltransferase complex transferase subunit TsaD [Myxococcales bacterium]